MYSVTDSPSFQGSVFGMHAIEVKPPAAAARVPLSIVSLCSCPGSRRCTCMSTSPGHTHRPVASSTRAPGGEAVRPCPDGRRSAIRPSSIHRSMTPSVFEAGSMTRPPLISNPAKGPPREEIQDGHPHGYAVRDLLEDDRVRPVRDGAVDLDAPVHRARMHDDGVRLGEARPLD